MSRIATQFSCRFELLRGMILRTNCFLSLGLDLVVGLVFDILQIVGGDDFSMQLQIVWCPEPFS